MIVNSSSFRDKELHRSTGPPGVLGTSFRAIITVHPPPLQIRLVNKLPKDYPTVSDGISIHYHGRRRHPGGALCVPRSARRRHASPFALRTYPCGAAQGARIPRGARIPSQKVFHNCIDSTGSSLLSCNAQKPSAAPHTWRPRGPNGLGPRLGSPHAQLHGLPFHAPTHLYCPLGLHQRGPAAWFDGTSYVNLCPVAPGTTYEYEFRVSTQEQPQRSNPFRTALCPSCGPGQPAALCTSPHVQLPGLYQRTAVVPAAT